MAGEEFERLRGSLLAQTHGTVLELGIGTGLNLPYYPASVTALHAVDPAKVLPRRVAARCAACSFPVHIQQVTAEALPFDDETFETAVSTWTLCSIPDPIQALKEVRRVLKPGGHFLFLEHGRSADEWVARWQDRLNPIQNLIGCGCHLNRRIDQLIVQAGLTPVQTDRFLMQSVPRLGGDMYRGVARSAHERERTRPPSSRSSVPHTP